MTTRITALTTGTVQIKTAMARGRGRGPLRLVRTLADRNYTGELPIHAWLIEHPEGAILVDTGELAGARDMPIARFSISPDEEIDQALTRTGVAPEALRTIVLTHLHGDHMNGVSRLAGVEVRASVEALAGGGARKLARIGVEATPLPMHAGPYGAFASSARLTADGTVLAVPVPGHAKGQIAVIVRETEQDVLIGADSAYTQSQLLDLHVDGVSISARAAVRSMQTILQHARTRATVFLPSHDPESASRLAARSPVPVP